jgi:hypothetical protein
MQCLAIGGILQSTWLMVIEFNDQHVDIGSKFKSVSHVSFTNYFHTLQPKNINLLR